jgi:hypothetical protein
MQFSECLFRLGEEALDISDAFLRISTSRSDDFGATLSVQTSDQDRSAIYHYGLPSAESFLHQEQIGLCYVVRFADSAHGQTSADALIQVLPFCCCQVLPQVRPNNSRRHCIHANRRQLQGKGACQGFDRSANAGGNNPSFMRALPGNSGGEHD